MMPVSTAILNHLLNQHPDVRAELAAHAGRRVALVLPPFTVSAVVTEEGWLAASEGEAEATVRVSAVAALLAQTSAQAPAFDALALDGDRVLARAWAGLLGRLRWQPADDLSRLVGDVAANRIERAFSGAIGLKGQIAWRLLESWLEHWREEQPILARSADVEQFVQSVDTLRDDTERLAKRLALFRNQQSDR